MNVDVLPRALDPGATADEGVHPGTDAWTALVDMPVGRHGAVAGRIGNGIYVAGGGTTGGSSYTADVDVFRYR